MTSPRDVRLLRTLAQTGGTTANTHGMRAENQDQEKLSVVGLYINSRPAKAPGLVNINFILYEVKGEPYVAKSGPWAGTPTFKRCGPLNMTTELGVIHRSQDRKINPVYLERPAVLAPYQKIFVQLNKHVSLPKDVALVRLANFALKESYYEKGSTWMRNWVASQLTVLEVDAEEFLLTKGPWVMAHPGWLLPHIPGLEAEAEAVKGRYTPAVAPMPEKHMDEYKGSDFVTYGNPTPVLQLNLNKVIRGEYPGDDCIMGPRFILPDLAQSGAQPPGDDIAVITACSMLGTPVVLPPVNSKERGGIPEMSFSVVVRQPGFNGIIVDAKIRKWHLAHIGIPLAHYLKNAAMPPTTEENTIFPPWAWRILYDVRQEDSQNANACVMTDPQAFVTLEQPQTICGNVIHAAPCIIEYYRRYGIPVSPEFVERRYKNYRPDMMTDKNEKTRLPLAEHRKKMTESNDATAASSPPMDVEVFPAARGYTWLDFVENRAPLDALLAKHKATPTAEFPFEFYAFALFAQDDDKMTPLSEPAPDDTLTPCECLLKTTAEGDAFVNADIDRLRASKKNAATTPDMEASLYMQPWATEGSGETIYDYRLPRWGIVAVAKGIKTVDLAYLRHPSQLEHIKLLNLQDQPPAALPPPPSSGVVVADPDRMELDEPKQPLPPMPTPPGIKRDHAQMSGDSSDQDDQGVAPPSKKSRT